MPLFDFFWIMLELFLFIIWFWILISIFGDIFRNPEMSGGLKAVWMIFVIILPMLGVMIYIVANGRGMQERTEQAAAAQEKRNREYIQQLAGTGPSTADELTKLKALRDSGVLTDTEFETQKAKLLS